MSMVACGVTQPWLEVWLCSSLACYFSICFHQLFSAPKWGWCLPQRVVEGIKEGHSCKVPSMPSTELASIIVHFLFMWEVAQWECLFTHHIPEAYLVMVGVWTIGYSWVCLEPHDVGFLESYGLVSLRPGWVLLFWVNLGQWFLTADRDH